MKILKLKFTLLLFALVHIIAIAQTPATGLNFDGTNDYVDLGDITATNFGTDDFTIEMWVKTNVNPTQNVSLISKRFICNRDNFWNFNMAPGGSFYFECDNNPNDYVSIFSTSTIVDNNWHHIVVQRNGSSITLFLDGNIENISVNNITNLNNNYSVLLGKNSCSDLPYGQYFNGSMDEVRIWNYARSQQEIMDGMSCELDGNEPGLISYYHFNQGIVGDNSSETILFDQSNGGTNNGILVNFLLNSPSSNWSEGIAITSCYPTPVPVSNWAIGIALFLILSVFILRFLKLF